MLVIKSLNNVLNNLYNIIINEINNSYITNILRYSDDFQFLFPTNLNKIIPN